MEPQKGVWNIYHAAGMSSAVPIHVAEELGLVDKQVVVKCLPKDANPLELLASDPTLLRLSPRRKLPVAVNPVGTTVLEAGAISLLLLESFDKDGKLHPLPNSSGRTEFIEGMVYAMSEALPCARRLFWKCYNIKKEDRDRETIEKMITDQWHPTISDHLLRHLKDGQQFYLGANFSAADIPFAYALFIAEMTGEDLFGDPDIKAYYDRVKARTTWSRVYGK
eukprot:CAMPEP_0198370098 /NCGR_PEP_ID=MMETSP1450-20131203/156544_1 /TAXON_ID=753684 ORGANISM="Madagascaria erythrocladiodes, Strain CCMP3234" /NCGR_SAMPLE_ID=MMETSP1450 /ASSEMBLY_ACC=CAM_ASM_001115 /LENGTH=221 /DNA_ID=CAMNT_0044077633 /DNA_START=841 /DNA_END=1506 /DNA_ORIENTATION=-